MGCGSNGTGCHQHHGCHHNHDGLDRRATCRFGFDHPVRLVLCVMGMMSMRLVLCGMSTMSMMLVRGVMLLRSRLFWRVVRRLWPLRWMTDRRGMANRGVGWPLCGMADRGVGWSLYGMIDRHIPGPRRRMANRRVRVGGGRACDTGDAAELRRSLHDRSPGSICLPAAQQRISSQGRAIQRRPGRYTSSTLVFVFSSRRWWWRSRRLYVCRPGRRAALCRIIAVRWPGRR